MFERSLIEHCSPTLASIKTASLFTITYQTQSDLRSQLEHWNLRLGGKGVALRIVRDSRAHALVYVYREKQLQRDLQRPGVAAFLRQYGYRSAVPAEAVAHLEARLRADDGFPHEIGLFLGYPLGDVMGFIENAGHNSKCCGCWKVYCNECEAVRQFARLRKCREIYLQLWSAGKSIVQLTVAA